MENMRRDKYYEIVGCTFYFTLVEEVLYEEFIDYTLFASRLNAPTI